MGDKESNKAENGRLKLARQLVADLAMPSRPDVLLEAVRVVEGFAPDPVTVTKVILADMALSAAVLHAANTQLPGWKRKVFSIEAAVALLGMERVRAIVAGQFLSATLVSQDGPLQRVRLRGVEAGRVAERLSRELPKIAPYCLNGYLPVVAADVAYTAGLLHDCGLVAMMRGFPEYAGFCQERHDQGETSWVDAENERFGTNHCLTGYWLVQTWGLPAPFCEVVRTHHRIDDFNRPGQKVKELKHTVLRAIIHLSASVCGGESEPEWQAVEERIADFFGLETVQLQRLRLSPGVV